MQGSIEEEELTAQRDAVVSLCTGLKEKVRGVNQVLLFWLFDFECCSGEYLRTRFIIQQQYLYFDTYKRSS